MVHLPALEAKNDIAQMLNMEQNLISRSVMKKNIISSPFVSKGTSNPGHQTSLAINTIAETPANVMIQDRNKKLDQMRKDL